MTKKIINIPGPEGNTYLIEVLVTDTLKRLHEQPAVISGVETLMHNAKSYEELIQIAERAIGDHVEFRRPDGFVTAATIAAGAITSVEPAMTFEELLEACLDAKQGDKEFVLTCLTEGQWYVALGNKSEHVAISEIITYGDHDVDFHATGKSPKEALEKLLQEIKAK